MSNTTITVRTNEHVKKKAQQYFETLGISLSAAVNIFLNDVVANKRLQFSIHEEYVELIEVDSSALPTEARNNLERVESSNTDDFHSLTLDDFND